MLSGLTGCTDEPATTAGHTTSASPAARSEIEPVRVWERSAFLAQANLVGATSWISTTDTPVTRAGASVPGPMIAYDAATGEQSWSTRPLGETPICAISPRYDGAAVVGVLGGKGCATLAGVNVATGALQWSRPVSDGDRTLRTGAGAIVLGGGGSLGQGDGPLTCFASADGSPVAAGSSACTAAAAELELVRSDGKPVVHNDFRELARHDGVVLGWLATESASQLFAFDEKSGRQLWQRARVNGETVFADDRGFVRVLPEGAAMALTRVDGRTWSPEGTPGSVPAIEFVARFDNVVVFLRPDSTTQVGWLTGYRLD
ncbi:hypothetical protein N803_04810 [Knoellia subterranea KCTC 19937]|uniref:Pyrrolo-quinoline quinone repeat domain-containing protein n=2 Tax=Knoellia TaxID=136099 RepID=A0A0A0JHF1_9MICO|nr:hypothetical protein N803_04810 [Knoellia subterranea KCTC 19937]